MKQSYPKRNRICRHAQGRFARVGIQYSRDGKQKAYLLACEECGSCVSTATLRKLQQEMLEAGSPKPRVLSAFPRMRTRKRRP